MNTVLVIFLLFNLHVAFSEELTFAQKEEKMNLAFKTKSRNGFIRWAVRVLSEDEKNFNALNKLGVYHLDRGQFVLARIIFERALKLYPKKAELHHNLGMVALKEKQKQEAILAFEKSLDYNKKYLPALVSLSSLYLENRNLRALPLLARAYDLTEESRNWFKVANNYAVSLAWAKEFKKARKVYRKIRRKNKATSLSMINYAILLMEQFGDYSEAEEVLEQADFLAKSKRDRNHIKALRKKVFAYKKRRK